MIIVIDDDRTFATKLDPIYARSSNEGRKISVYRKEEDYTVVIKVD